MSDHGEEKERMDPSDAESGFELWNCRDCVSGYFPDIGGCLLDKKEAYYGFKQTIISF